MVEHEPNIVRLLLQKPSALIVASLVYILVVSLLHSGFRIEIGTFLFILGGLFGMYVLDAAELFFHLVPSPFRTIFFSGLVTIVSFFIITSSGSLFATGIVLLLVLHLLLLQLGEWKIAGNINSWFRIIAVCPQVPIQLRIIGVELVLFISLTILFIRS